MQTLAIAQEKAFFQQRVELEGVSFVLDFAWSERAGANGSWSLSVLTDEGVALVTGVTIVSNRLLLRRFHYIPGMPAGDLMFASYGSDLPVPGFADLTELIYITAAELNG